jgi:hypothetical protein
LRGAGLLPDGEEVALADENSARIGSSSTRVASGALLAVTRLPVVSAALPMRPSIGAAMLV